MATRTISTRLAVEGESEYKAAVSSVNAELRNMQSALQLVESQYKSNSTSTEALTAKGKALNDLLATQQAKVAAVESGLENAKKAEEEYTQRKEELTEKIKANTQALEELKNAAGDTSDEEKRLTEENQQLNQKLEENEAKLKASSKAVNQWKTDLNKAQSEVNNTEDAIRENNDALDQNSDKMGDNANAVNNLAETLVAAGLAKAVKEVAEALMDCVSASIEFESAMAGVKKTTDMSSSELKDMADEIENLSTEIPITTTELASIAETAGQLGIAKEDLISFSTVMANLGVATNMTSDEAATLLAKFANVTGMSPDLYENLGSVVVELGNNFATTESEVVEMGQKLASAGTLAGLSEPEIMALATAMSSVGIQAEAGGTAMTQTLTAMEKAVASGGDDLTKFAEIAGMSADDFAAAWETAPITAIEAFIEGLGNLDEQGESATLVLDDLGLSGIRQSNMLKSLASASSLLSTAVSTANTAWVENTALTKEAETRYATTESKITMFKNSVNNLKIAVGDQLNPAINDLVSHGTDVIKWATEFVEANQWLAPVIASLTGGLCSMTTAMVGFKAVSTVIPIIRNFNKALGDNPAFAVATAILVLVGALGTLALALQYPTEEADDLREAMDSVNDSVKTSEKTYKSTTKEVESTAKVLDKYIDRLAELEKQSSLTEDEQAEYNRLVSEVARIMPDANTAINETTGFLEIGADALRESADEWKNLALAAAESAYVQAMTEALTDAYVALITAQSDLDRLQADASEQTLSYADALMALNNAQANLSAVQKDSSSSFWDVEAAQQAVEKAQNNLIDSASGLTNEEKAAGAAIAALKEEMEKAEENVATYEEKVSALEESMSKTGEAAGTIAEGVQQASDAISNAAETSGEELAAGFQEGIQGMAEATETAMSDVEAAVETGSEEIVPTVTDIGTQSVSGFETELDKMEESATSALSSTLTTVSSYSTDAYSSGYAVGAAISQGAAAGVMAYASSVAEQAAAMVTNAIAAAKTAADSHSPSKKTFVLGQDLDKGTILGIKDLEDEVVATMQNTMDRVVSVQADVPDIPDNTGVILAAMGGGNGDSEKLIDALNRFSSKGKDLPAVVVNQYFYGEQTSYYKQQKLAQKNMEQLIRSL